MYAGGKDAKILLALWESGVFDLLSKTFETLFSSKKRTENRFLMEFENSNAGGSPG